MDKTILIKVRHITDIHTSMSKVPTKKKKKCLQLAINSGLKVGRQTSLDMPTNYTSQQEH